MATQTDGCADHAGGSDDWVRQAEQQTRSMGRDDDTKACENDPRNSCAARRKRNNVVAWLGHRDSRQT